MGMKSHSIKKYSEKIRRTLQLHRMPVGLRRVIVGCVGTVLLLAGIAMIFLPGPAFVMIPLGLAVLGTEFVWAQRYLVGLWRWFKRTARKVRTFLKPSSESSK